MSALFSAKNRGVMLNPLSKGNPVIVLVLVICFADAKYHSDPYPYHRTIGRCGRSCNHRRSAVESFRLRCQQTAVRICRIDHHQLYHHGTYRSFRPRQ